MILLSDITEYEFRENFFDEKLISLRNLKSVVIDETQKQISSKSEYFCFVRETVYSMLEKASDILPIGYQFLIKEGYRPASIQHNSFIRILNKYKNSFPSYNEKELLKLVSEFVAPLNLAGHPTGGAIDVTLLENGNEIFMGTEFNDEPNETNNRTYLKSQDISNDEKKYRNVLTDALTITGFINYPPEWWHWSFGDKYWAYNMNESVKYRAILDEEVRNLTTASTG